MKKQQTFNCTALYIRICIACVYLGCATVALGIQINGGGRAGKLFEAYPLIVGGIESVPHSHPYIIDLSIRIQTGEVKRCGGVILTEEWILTAGHCVFNITLISVSAGKHDLSKVEETEQKVGIAQSIVDIYVEDTVTNDVALIKVTPKLEFNDFVKPGVLASADLNPTGMATVAGWGSEIAVTPEDQGNATDGGQGLREVRVPIIDNEQCKKTLAPLVELPLLGTNICAGYEEGKKDACHGDSGGPLFQKMENGKEIIIGLVSWGAGCAQPKLPGVYTRVNKYLDYIKKHTGYSNDEDRGNSLTSDVAENLCHQYFTYLAKDCITEPVPTPPPSHLKCGWFNWSKNCSQSSCTPFSFSKC